ncbi:MAG: glycerophosphodiester phosphodiesterase [Acidimicrobiia bacterium]
MAYETPPWTQIVAHRGNSGPLPENTLIAINSAIELGVDMVEVDVRLTRDGVPILMHNDRVDGTTSGTGLVEDLTWDGLSTLDAGSWRGSQFAGESVRSLQEVLESTVGRVALNLDIKEPEAVEPAAIAAAEIGASANIVISGCPESCVRMVGNVDNGISTLLNLDELLAGIDPAEAPAIASQSIDVALQLGVIAINVPHPLVDANLVDQARAAGIGVWAYTVDEEDRFSELMDMGIASLTTTWPERMVPLARDRSSRPGINR